MDEIKEADLFIVSGGRLLSLLLLTGLVIVLSSARRAH